MGEGELSFRHEDSVQRKVYTKEALLTSPLSITY